MVVILEGIILYNARKYQSCTLLESVTLYSIKRYQSCTLLEIIILHSVKKYQPYTVLESMNFILIIKIIDIYINKYQLCTIHK